MVKILHICSGYDTSSVYRNLFSALERVDVENIIMVPNHMGSSQRVLYVDRRFSKFEKLLYWGEQKYLTEFIEKEVNIRELNCIHAHRLFYGGAIGLRLKNKYGIPYIVAVRNSDLYGFGRNLSRFKKHGLEILLNASKVIFISETYKEETLHKYISNPLYNMLEEKSIVCPNGISDYFHENRMDLNTHNLPQQKRIIIASFGSIERNKNQLITSNACEILINKGYKVELILAGEIKDRKMYDTISNKTYVRYIGKVNHEEIVKYLRLSDVFVLPSYHETFGLVYVEAMSQGVPVIYTRGEGFDGQFSEGEVGYPVNPSDANEIASRILDILINYRNISNRCIANSERFSWRKIARKYVDMYNEI